MKLQQLTGPFAKGSSITFSNINASYVHLGIQVPNCAPLSWKNDSGEWTSDGAIQTDLTIGGVGISSNGYKISSTGILEFDGELETGSLTITFNRQLPMNTIIDIIYKNTGE